MTDGPIERALALQRAVGNRAATRLLARNNDGSGGRGRGTATGDTSPSTDYRGDSRYVDRIIGHVFVNIATNTLEVQHESGQWATIPYEDVVRDMTAAAAPRAAGTVTLQVPPTYRDERSGLIFPSYWNEQTAPNIIDAVRRLEAERPAAERRMQSALIEMAVAARGVASGAMTSQAQAGATRAGATAAARGAGTVREAVASAEARITARADRFRELLQRLLRRGERGAVQRMLQQIQREADEIRDGTSALLSQEMSRLSGSRRADLAGRLQAAASEASSAARTGVRVEVSRVQVVPQPPGQVGVRGYTGGTQRDVPVTVRSYGSAVRGHRH